MTTDKFLRNLPKIQLHCHLEGTLRATSFIDLANRHGVALRYHPSRAAGSALAGRSARNSDEVYEFDDFEDFLLTFAAVSRSLATPEDYGRLAREYVEDALAQNVIYAELFISPSVWTFFHRDLDVRACVRAMRQAFNDAAGALQVRLIADVTRNFGARQAMITARQAVDLQDLGVIGIGLGGDEANYPAELFEPVYAFARKQGLRAVTHAGEAAGAHSVRAAIEVLGAERIGHGVRALEDPNVVRMLVESRIPLELCPTSNQRTGVWDGQTPHPLVSLDAAGCVVTIDADDPGIFRTSVTEEYAFVERTAGRDTLLRMLRNAADATFTDKAGKAALHSRLEAYLNNVRA